MATKKAGKKSTKKKTTSSSKTKPSGKSPKRKPVKGRKKKNIAPGQEPIIIGGGGSVNMRFPPSFMNMSTGPGRRFRNPIADLRSLIVVPGDGSRPKRITLFDNDTIYICFTGSDCPDVDAEDC